MQPTTDAPAPLQPGEPGSAPDAAPFGVFAIGLAAIACVLQLFAVASAQALLDAQILDLRRDLARAREASPRSAEIAAEIASLHAVWETDFAARAIPCELDGPTLVAEICARAGELGVDVDVETAVQRHRRKDFYYEVPVLVKLPASDDGSIGVITAALRGSEPHFVVFSKAGARGATVLAFQYTCPDFGAPAPVVRLTPPGRDRLVWPFDRGVTRREREIDELLEQRRREAGVLSLLEQERALALEIDRRRTVYQRLAREPR